MHAREWPSETDLVRRARQASSSLSGSIHLRNRLRRVANMWWDMLSDGVFMVVVDRLFQAPILDTPVSR